MAKREVLVSREAGVLPDWVNFSLWICSEAAALRLAVVFGCCRVSPVAWSCSAPRSEIIDCESWNQGRESLTVAELGHCNLELRCVLRHFRQRLLQCSFVQQIF